MQPTASSSARTGNASTVSSHRPGGGRISTARPPGGPVNLPASEYSGTLTHPPGTHVPAPAPSEASTTRPPAPPAGPFPGPAPSDISTNPSTIVPAQQTYELSPPPPPPSGFGVTPVGNKTAAGTTRPRPVSRLPRPVAASGSTTKPVRDPSIAEAKRPEGQGSGSARPRGRVETSSRHPPPPADFDGFNRPGDNYVTTNRFGQITITSMRPNGSVRSVWAGGGEVRDSEYDEATGEPINRERLEQLQKTLARPNLPKACYDWLKESVGLTQGEPEKTPPQSPDLNNRPPSPGRAPTFVPNPRQPEVSPARPGPYRFPAPTPGPHPCKPATVGFLIDTDILFKKEKVPGYHCVMTPRPGATQVISFLVDRKVPFLVFDESDEKNISPKDLSRNISKSLQLKQWIEPKHIVQTTSPFRVLLDDHRFTTVLVLGGDGEQACEVARSYGFKNVLRSLDISASNLQRYGQYLSLEERTQGVKRPFGGGKLPDIGCILVFWTPKNWELDAAVVMDVLLSKYGDLTETVDVAEAPTDLLAAPSWPKLYICDAEDGLHNDNPGEGWIELLRKKWYSKTRICKRGWIKLKETDCGRICDHMTLDFAEVQLKQQANWIEPDGIFWTRVRRDPAMDWEARKRESPDVELTEHSEAVENSLPWMSIRVTRDGRTIADFPEDKRPSLVVDSENMAQGFLDTFQHFHQKLRDEGWIPMLPEGRTFDDGY
ncbi:hypothetical protein B0H63DRAFT_471722 [Podospora didyma]|uniref:Uncharacterized protein n=1 Tax=Podospora didyma TaxID=330526 RepID=A0AAE0NNN8_9PEZI|nr:hypothetical protein B0H63DRAFT_471722 [Podospora didyma]